MVYFVFYFIFGITVPPLATMLCKSLFLFIIKSDIKQILNETDRNLKNEKSCNLLKNHDFLLTNPHDKNITTTLFQRTPDDCNHDIITT
uniref:Uncharacterized protein n=1 Tax=Ornithodoros brasiliensis TaxID=888526 RepID=A0A1D2AID0_ORNBR